MVGDMRESISTSNPPFIPAWNGVSTVKMSSLQTTQPKETAVVEYWKMTFMLSGGGQYINNNKTPLVLPAESPSVEESRLFIDFYFPL